ncbi:hypothetical protein ANN_02941 [Periplaneta americana]|uniref:Reverse transcriptase domain-containing protein n=1 Tax=Periplaneta americana TaxID=6978 RepID=A0ABQ8TYU6_PERAM|nr:hypothetical protein ANN_02941 [Periplaneta americana]
MEELLEEEQFGFRKGKENWHGLEKDKAIQLSSYETSHRIGEEMSEGNEIGKGVCQGCPLSPILFNIYLVNLVKNCFQNMGGVIVGGRRIKCIRFADVMVLLAQEEMILKNMLLELNDSCEQYGMKINANKTKSMVIGRKIQKINLRFLNEAIEQVDSFKYLECTLSSNMSCCLEVKRRIAMAKEAFKRKRSIFCGPLEKQLRKRLVKCFVWSVALYEAETWTLWRNEEKQIEAFEIWIWRRMECVKWTDRIRNEAVLERVSEERMMLKLIRKMKRIWLGHWLRRNCILNDTLEGMVNGRRVRILHSVLVLFQATTLNVAINSNNKALLTIMMSNNTLNKMFQFVELKGSVFKKFDKNNLFQVSCSDVRERFHLFVLLFIVVLQTMKEYSWKEERFWVLIPDCLMVLFAEVLVDWIKHAFITRFNELQVDVYRDYTISLAYDMAQTRQKHAFSDHSDLVARRMGFIPLPLGVVMVRVLCHALHLDGPAAVVLLIISYLCLASFRILNSVVILGKACDLISQHQQEKAAAAASPAWSRATSPVNGRPHHPASSVVRDLSKDMRDQTTSPTRVLSSSIVGPPLQRSITVDLVPLSDGNERSEKDKPPECALGPAAIFSNSAVSINNVCLNEELLKAAEEAETEKELSGKTDMDDCLTRSVPNIHANVDSETKESFSQEISSSFANEDFAKKRAESEPSIPHLVESERTELPPP